MFLKRTIILSLIQCWLLVPLLAQETMSFSLEEAIAYALENNVDVKNAELENESSDYQVKEFLAIGMPQISAGVNVSTNVVLPKTPVPGEFFGGEPGSFQFVAFSPKHQGSLNVTLDQLIFDASYFIGLNAARTIKELTYKQYGLSKVQMTENVTKAYYTALVQDERLELFERQLGTLDTLLLETTLMLENGFAEKIDENRVRVQYNNIKTDRDRFERVAALSLDLLKFQLGIPVSTDIELTDNLDDIQLLETVPTLGDFNYNNRMEYSILNTNYELQQINVRNIRSGYYPNLKGFATLGGNSGSPNFGDVASFDFSGSDRSWFENVTVGLSLNIPIFDSFQKYNQIQQVKVDLKQIENNKIQTQNVIDMEISSATADLLSATENLETQQINLELAREIYDVSKIKFQQGVGSNIEVTNATTTLKEAEINYYNALYDALIAKVDLQKALGILSN
ncbi:MAG: TolC family protein [Cyclobacteriaceae bacterium]